MMYPYGYVGRVSPRFSPRFSSRPSHLTAPNGLNLSKSIGNPISRFERIREYLRTNGPSTKKDILYYVFGKTVGPFGHGMVTMGWGSYVFGLGVKYGYFRKEQKGGTTYWSLT